MPNALVTGASQGLGLALARGLADHGWGLVVDARGRAALRAAAEAIAGSGAAAVTAVPGDVIDPAHRAALASAAAAAGGLDALVLNAGALGPSPRPDLADYPIDALLRLLEVNAVAPLAVTQAVLPYLRPRAAVVAITSDAAREPYAGWGGYGASKAALEQLFAVLAAERKDLRVLIVDPGDLRTDMHQRAFPGEDIGDRPLPEARVPDLVALIEDPEAAGRIDLSRIGAAA
jgi:NAD(P)-dependent dehydrogenase (short-subunit alcohol dehydrogenase family)